MSGFEWGLWFRVYSGSTIHGHNPTGLQVYLGTELPMLDTQPARPYVPCKLGIMELWYTKVMQDF